MPNQDRQSILTTLETRDLQGARLRVTGSDGEEVRVYKLIEKVGRGKTAVAWKAHARGRNYAIKFAPKADFGSHSLDAEVLRIQKLNSNLVAGIEFYGEPSCDVAEIPWENLYAITVEWIEGQTLSEYLAATTEIDVATFVSMARDLCQLLKALGDCKLQHNDLHDENLMVRVNRDGLTGGETVQIVAIDTGQLKSEERRVELIEKFREQLGVLESLDASADIEARKKRAKDGIGLFERTDHEWVVRHLCSIINASASNPNRTRVNSSAMTERLLPVFDLAIDSDPSRRLDDPLKLFVEIERVASQATVRTASMTSPFDFPSAELIRSDRQLMTLFSNDYPKLDACRSDAPTYIYGPRGCGKSTLLRSLSLKAVLDSEDPTKSFDEISFIGIYISCSSELRSRFWLFDESDFEKLKAHIVRYFGLLLLEELVETLARMHDWDEANPPFTFDISDEIGRQACEIIRRRAEIQDDDVPYAAVSPFTHLATQIRLNRDRLWKKILDLETPSERVDAQLVFDICHELEELCPIFKVKKLSFLLDDYSNQRIPPELQKRLNQAITFAKQGAPIFKVSSEYFGVELEGIQEGREVLEVNVGAEYVKLQGKERWSFLKQLLEKRFAYLDAPIVIEDVLGESKIGAAIDMSRRIIISTNGGEKFRYFGIDTISDVCSGDFAMGLDLVRKIFEQSNTNWKSPARIPDAIQHRVIQDYGAREFEYIRYRWLEGPKKYQIIDRLCWLTKQCLLYRTLTRDGKQVPYLKNSLDISETALQQLEEHSVKQFQLLDELIRKGVLFPLQTSRSRDEHSGTRRFMVRRILLTRHLLPLGRDVAIKIDNLERLRTLLSDPVLFVQNEFDSTGVKNSKTSESEPDAKQKIFFEDDDADDKQN